MSTSYVRFVNTSLPTVNQINSIGFVPDPKLEIQLGNYENISTGSIYGHAQLQSAVNWVSVAPTPAPKVLPLIPAPGIACALSYEHVMGGAVDTTTQIVIECYETDTDTSTVTKVITLDDINKVTIPGTIYRIKNMFVNPGGPAVVGTGNIYIYDDTLVPVLGVPADYFDIMRMSLFGDPDYANLRETAIYYSPPGTTTYAHNIQISTNNEIITKSLSFEIVLNENHTWHFTFYPGSGLFIYNEPFIEISPGVTVHLKAKAPNTTSTCPITFTMDLLVYTPP